MIELSRLYFEGEKMIRYLGRTEAAEYLTNRGLVFAKSTLAKLATIGGGPQYYKFGNRAVYDPSDLDEWIRWKLGDPRGSTSEAD